MTPDTLTRRRRAWPVVTGLLILAAVPVIAGAFRATELMTDPQVTVDNARFVAAPAPVLLHIVAATVYAVLGAFQFAPGLRRTSWHRRAGRLLVPAGLLVAGTGLWMTARYELPPLDGQALSLIRYAVGVAMAAFLVLAVRAIRRRDVPTHAAWMIRAYALAMGAGTQAFTHLPLLVPGVPTTEGTRTVAMGLGWVINIVVAELVIRRHLRRR
ncbi:DUF2306 domain-containing protein [Nocardioides limicola]|uniref:DUF2306 domain-containing protein n=1 Tax=Nocardioides limicola TaxID=2803368 RepID=UPI00193B7E4F|nr:DUF2306 domain-containing protein [Nocardioides sp. DJM-14]